MKRPNRTRKRKFRLRKCKCGASPAVDVGDFHCEYWGAPVNVCVVNIICRNCLNRLNLYIEVSSLFDKEERKRVYKTAVRKWNKKNAKKKKN